MKAFSTMGSKRGKGKRGFTLIELLIVMVILAILAGVVVMAVGGVFGTAKEQAYNSVVPQVQNAVTAYMVEHNGQLPPSEGAGTAVNISTPPGGFVQDAEVLDICTLVGEQEDMLRTVPDGCMGATGDAGSNFYAGPCNRSTEDNGHYVFFIDNVGNVYTGCDCDEDGTIEEAAGGVENVSEYSGNCTATDIWP
jgi:type IV pilus assembly protein PilA